VDNYVYVILFIIVFTIIKGVFYCERQIFRCWYENDDGLFG